MIYIGLDLSLTNTGCIALNDKGSIIQNKSFGYSLTKKATDKELVERYIDITKGIVDFIDQYKIEDIICGVEQYSFNTVKGKFGRKMQSASQSGLAELRGTIKSQLCLMFGFIPVGVVASSARKLILGKGNFEKKEIRSALEAMGHKLDDGDQADAFLIAEYLRKNNKEKKNE